MSEAKWRTLLEQARRHHCECQMANDESLRLLAAEVERIEVGIRNRDESIKYLSGLAKRETDRAEVAEAALATVHFCCCCCCGEFLTGRRQTDTECAVAGCTHQLNQDVRDPRCAAIRVLVRR